jgi:hypothetical protein
MPAVEACSACRARGRGGHFSPYSEFGWSCCRRIEVKHRLTPLCRWFWPIPLITLCLLCPESPWWLIKKDRIESARKAIYRLVSKPKDDFNPDQIIALMQETDRLEREVGRSPICDYRADSC